MFPDEGEKRLRRLLDGLVERLGWGMAVLSQNLVLGEEHALNPAHELG